MSQQGSSGRLLRQSTAEKSRASLEARGKRKSSFSEDGNSFNPQSMRKKQKLETSVDNSKANTFKAKRGRPPSSSKQKEQELKDSDKNQVGPTFSSNFTDQLSSLRANEKSPSKAASISINSLIGSGNQSIKNSESENLTKINSLKCSSFSNIPIGTANFSGNVFPEVIDSKELLEFLTGLEGVENKEPQNIPFANNVLDIKRLEKSPSRFFECPLCYKVFIDGNLARSHLANTCPKLQ